MIEHRDQRNSKNGLLNQFMGADCEWNEKHSIGKKGFLKMLIFPFQVSFKENGRKCYIA
jgi:hypothetical protein